MKEKELLKCGIHEGKEWLPEKQKLIWQPLYKIFGRLGGSSRLGESRNFSESSWFGQSGSSTTTTELIYQIKLPTPRTHIPMLLAKLSYMNKQAYTNTNAHTQTSTHRHAHLH